MMRYYVRDVLLDCVKKYTWPRVLVLSLWCM